MSSRPAERDGTEPHTPQVTPGRLSDAALGFVTAVVLASIAASVLMVIDPELVDGAAGLVVPSLAMWVGFIGVPLSVSRRRGTGDLGQDFGLRARWSDAAIGVPLGAATQLLALPALYFLLGAFVDTSALSDPAKETMDRASGLATAAVILVVGVGAPIAEELFFRGLSQRAAQARFGNVRGLLLVAAVFGASHFQPLQFPGLFLAGLVFGVLAWRSGRLGPAVFAHIGFNMAAVVVLLWGS